VIAHVVIATKDRASEVFTLLSHLARQTLQPDRILVVGTSASDIAGLDRHPIAAGGLVELLIASRTGLTIQRNVALSALRSGAGLPGSRKAFVAFFDDDFRPADDWLERCADRLARDADVVGVTGRVLADGVRSIAISEADAESYLSGVLPPQKHWSDMPAGQDVASLYGCNMAFIDDVARACSFDEELPLYGWQEDCDYTGQAKQYGRTVIDSGCRGVHLGVKGGRTSGVRFGYSQIANPLHIASKGRMTRLRAARFVLRALAANVVRSVPPATLFDYRGRLRGNLRAVFDLMRGKCRPREALNLH
jgi:glycosyltransferase involved in cell wall biosynthesis